MEVDAILDLSYETQYFGFHPRGFVDGVYNAIQDYLREGLDAMQKFLAEEYGTIIPKKDVQARAQAMMQILTTKLDKATDRLEVYLNRNVFVIPSHVVLPEDKIHMTNPVTKEKAEALDQEISEMKQKIIQAKYRKTFLQNKIQEQEVIKSKEMEIVNRHQLLIHLATEAGIPDFYESVAYNVSKTSKLFDIVQHISKLVQKPDPKHQCPD